jgi:hypothetical protein
MEVISRILFRWTKENHGESQSDIGMSINKKVLSTVVSVCVDVCLSLINFGSARYIHAQALRSIQLRHAA